MSVDSSLLMLRKHRVIIWKDALNKLKYGLNAPVKNQTLYCDPMEIKRHSYVGESFAGRVEALERFDLAKNDNVIASWDCSRFLEPIESKDVVQRVVLKYSKGLSWREVGEYGIYLELIRKNGIYDGCRTVEDLDKRYDLLDKIFEEAKSTGRLKSMSQVNPMNFRELGGIDVIITGEGEIVKFWGGWHRFSIARTLRLPAIPVCVKAVHPACIKNGKWGALLKESSRLEVGLKSVA